MSKVTSTGIGCQLTPKKANELTQIELKANEALARANAIPQGSIVPGHVLYKRGDIIKTQGQEAVCVNVNDCNARFVFLANRGQTVSISNNHNPLDKFIIRAMDGSELEDFLIRGISRREKGPTKQPKADKTESELNMDGKEKAKGKTKPVKKAKTAKGKTTSQRGKQNKVFGFSAGTVVAALAKAGANKAQIAAIFAAKDAKLGLPIALSPITIRVMYDSGRGGCKRCEPAKISPDQRKQLMDLVPKALAEVGNTKVAKVIRKPKAAKVKPVKEVSEPAPESDALPMREAA